MFPPFNKGAHTVLNCLGGGGAGRGGTQFVLDPRLYHFVATPTPHNQLPALKYCGYSG